MKEKQKIVGKIKQSSQLKKKITQPRIIHLKKMLKGKATYRARKKVFPTQSKKNAKSGKK